MHLGRATVYVVDDDPSVRRSLGRLIRSAGLEVSLFASADEFFESSRCDRNVCLIVDAKMPRVGGLDMLIRLQAERIGIPVIVITAHDDAETRKQAEEAGAVGFFRKPVDAEALLDAVQWAITGAN